MRRVVVTGLGIVSSIGHGAEEVTQSLREARSGVVHAPDHAKYGFRSQVWAPPKIGPWEELIDRRAARFLANGTAWGQRAPFAPFSPVTAVVATATKYLPISGGL